MTCFGMVPSFDYACQEKKEGPTDNKMLGKVVNKL